MTAKKKILFIGGSRNQTTQMHKISEYLKDYYDCWFSNYYSHGFIGYLAAKGLLEFTILGNSHYKKTFDYCLDNRLKFDSNGLLNEYDLVFTSSDLIVPKNIRGKKIILVQEGMTDPENLMYHIVKHLKLPRYLASTSTTGLSDAYKLFCVASEGYKEHFINKGCNPEKITVTGIPNFDNAAEFLENDFPHKGYVMVATSDSRETFKYENRKKFILEAKKIAAGRRLLFKFHPNENFLRATREVEAYAPGSLIYTAGNTNHMIANCDVLITKYSSVVYVGIALGKEVYSYFNLNDLKKMVPIQNGGSSAKNIAAKAIELLEGEIPSEFFEQSYYPFKKAANN